MDGPIPAQAGEPSITRAAYMATRAYPRAGGGTRARRCDRVGGEGLSPRRRGNPRRSNPRGTGTGPIPAPAGGTPRRSNPRETGTGPIPAQAGEPLQGSDGMARSRAYPRAGGGTRLPRAARSRQTGLSPRRRGNQLGQCASSGSAGPIPAQAGEPDDRSPCVPSCRAYPRAGGGTVRQAEPLPDFVGLSPRRRGNPIAKPFGGEPRGPIPAQAGEPWTSRACARCTRAYPRAGGGTVPGALSMGSMQGLSPRRRGNQLIGDSQGKAMGPIPAQAGEPPPCGRAPRCTGAYPRAGGGTTALRPLPLGSQGLSPRRRGNRRALDRHAQPQGPIPAQAGEPLVTKSLNSWQCQRAGSESSRD